MQEENTLQNDLIGVEKHFEEFETHVVTTIQNALSELNNALVAGREREAKLYADSTTKATAIPADFEYSNFVKRNGSILIPYDSPPRSVEQIRFPNEDHESTKAVLTGAIMRKGKIMRSYSPSYYILTPSGFLHEFKDQDSHGEPEMSLYLPDCTIGALGNQPENNTKFVISGKDAGSRLAGKHDFRFKAGNVEEAKRWYEALSKAAGIRTEEEPPVSTPVTATGEESMQDKIPPPYESRDAMPSVAETTGVPQTGQEKMMANGKQPPTTMSGAGTVGTAGTAAEGLSGTGGNNVPAAAPTGPAAMTGAAAPEKTV